MTTRPAQPATPGRLAQATPPGAPSPRPGWLSGDAPGRGDQRSAARSAAQASPTAQRRAQAVQLAGQELGQGGPVDVSHHQNGSTTPYGLASPVSCTAMIDRWYSSAATRGLPPEPGMGGNVVDQVRRSTSTATERLNNTSQARHTSAMPSRPSRRYRSYH